MTNSERYIVSQASGHVRWDLSRHRFYTRSLLNLQAVEQRCSIETSQVRVRQVSSALKVSDSLEKQSDSEQALHVGLLSHAQHGIARRKLKGFGHILTVSLSLINDDLSL